MCFASEQGFNGFQSQGGSVWLHRLFTAQGSTAERVTEGNPSRVPLTKPGAASAQRGLMGVTLPSKGTTWMSSSCIQRTSLEVL